MPTQSKAAFYLQDAINEALARTCIYRFLAKGFEGPSPENWQTLTDEQFHQTLRRSINALAKSGRASLEAAAQAWLDRLNPEHWEQFKLDYNAAFGHAARGLCPLNEIEYGDVKADPLFQPHRLADLAAFYQAFGLEIASDAGERQDHICLELEFMCVLAAREAYALEFQDDEELIELERGAQKNFLREHLARWVPGFSRRLARLAGSESSLGCLANLVREFIALDCQRCGVAPGSEDLLLRPVDAAAESLCASCGINSLPPGALRTEASEMANDG